VLLVLLSLFFFQHSLRCFPITHPSKMEKNMNKKQILMTLCVVVLTTSVLAFDKPTQIAKRIFGFVSQAQATKQQNSPTAKMQNDTIQEVVTNNSMPDYVVYDVLFNMVKVFDREAAKLESEGKNGKIWSEYFKHESGLTGEQVATLRKVADEFAVEIEPNRTRAMQIIKEARGAFPNGKIKERDVPPPPSNELIALQQQRQEIALRYRDRLQNLLGNEVFGQFSQYLQQNFVNNMRFLDDVRPSLLERANRFAEKTNQAQSDRKQGGQKQ
jgi:hypothetical protein